MNPETANLVERYRLTSSEKERAEIESALWNSAKNKSSTTMREFLPKLTGAKPGAVEIRSTIHNSITEVSQVLWDHIDNKGMSLYTAVRLLREARTRSAAADNPERVDIMLAVVMAEYEKNSFSCTTKSGKTFRKRSPSNLRSFSHVKARSSKPPAKVKDTNLWATVRSAFSTEMAERLSGIDTYVAESLWSEFETELKFVLESFQNRVYNIKKRELSGGGVTVHRVTRKDVVNACRTLHMEPPPQGKPADMKVARKMKYKLARLYHPDANGGREVTRPQYEAVIASFEFLVNYNNTFNTHTGATSSAEDSAPAV